MTDKTMPQWYALQSKPREEEAVRQHVTSEGIECYYPCVRVHTVNPRARQVKPYFPSYLFVHLDGDTANPYLFRWIPHVVRLICCGDDPTPVPDALLAAIRRRVADFEIANIDPAHGLKHGDYVSIKAGPFEGYEAFFDTRLSGHDRVRVLLELINGSSITLDLHAVQVERAPSRGMRRL